MTQNTNVTYNLTHLSKMFGRDRDSVLNHIKYLNLYQEGQKQFSQDTVNALISFYEEYKDLTRTQLTQMIKKHKCFLKYGVESPNQREEVKEKKKQTTLQKYGVENPSQSDIIKERKKKTSQEHFGVDHPTQCDAVQNKTRETCKKKYGVEYSLQSEVVRNKAKQTSLEKYGTESPNSSHIVKENQKKSFLEKYGAEKPLQLQLFQNKRTDTIRRKYGVDNNSQTQEWLNNWKLKEPEILLKRSKVVLDNITRFEADNDCTQRMDLVRKYGQGWLSLDIPRLKYKNVQFIPNKYIDTIIKFYNDVANKLQHGTSQEEKDVVQWIKSFYTGEILENSKRIIPPYELDIYIPEKNVAIEFNGNYWHSEEMVKRTYHEIKSKLCEEKGIRLIHIYECEWIYSKEKIQSLLRLALGVGYSKIGARQCIVKKITNDEAEPFNNKNHLQSHRRALVTYGLFYNNELVQLMSFSHNSKYQWEIIRGCPGSNNQVVGGVSKLFKAFLKEYNPDMVFSYCDFNKFDGKGYEALGMKLLGYTGPDKFYVDKSGAKVMRSPKKRKELEETCPFIIYGAGSKKYLYTKEGLV